MPDNSAMIAGEVFEFTNLRGITYHDMELLQSHIDNMEVVLTGTGGANALFAHNPGPFTPIKDSGVIGDFIYLKENGATKKYQIAEIHRSNINEIGYNHYMIRNKPAMQFYHSDTGEDYLIVQYCDDFPMLEFLVADFVEYVE